MARREKKPVHLLLQEYDIKTAEDIQDTLKDLLGETIKEMMEVEIDGHLGYAKSEQINRALRL